MKTKKIILAAAIFSIFNFQSIVCQAQENGGYNESVVVRGSYKPVIEKSDKINFPATITDTLGRIERDFTYSVSTFSQRPLYQPTKLKAVTVRKEPTTKLYNNYLRLGFGNYWSPLADLYWNSTRDKKKTYGLRLNHRSSWGRIPCYGKNHFGQTGATLFGKYIVGETLQLSSDLSYEHDHNLYYGFRDSLLASMGIARDSINLFDIRASYNIATWNIGVKNMQLDPNKLGYAANVRVGDLWTVWGMNEFNLNVSGDIHYGFSIKNRYKGVAYLHAELDGYTHSHRQDTLMPYGNIPFDSIPDTVRGYRDIVKLNPFVDFLFGGFQFHAGFTAGWDAFTLDTATVFRFFPDVVVSKSLLRDALVLSLGATGGFDANNWNTMRRQNPYLAPGAEQRATRHYDFVFHARWNISRKLEANAEISYQLLQDDLTFCIDSNYLLGNVFRPHYFDNNRLTLGGTVTFVNDEMLTLRAGGHYYLYTNVDNHMLPGDSLYASRNSKVLYRPNWDVLLSARVNYHDKWLFYLEGSLLGSMQGDWLMVGTDEVADVMPLRYGVAAEVEYRHNRALSFFLRMDNLAFQRYWYWSHYPSQRGLFILGLTYTIPNK